MATRYLNSILVLLYGQDQIRYSQDEYNAFFSDMGAGFGEPLLTLHNVSEGAVNFTNLLCRKCALMICLTLRESQGQALHQPCLYH